MAAEAGGRVGPTDTSLQALGNQLDGAIAAFMAEVVPGAYAWIGNGVEGKGSCMVHNPGYDFNDDILAIGASYWVRLTEAYLAD